MDLDSFSGYGVGEEGVEDREYNASDYYSEEHKNHKIHFTIFWNTKVHNTKYVYTVLILMEHMSLIQFNVRNQLFMDSHNVYI